MGRRRTRTRVEGEGRLFYERGEGALAYRTICESGFCVWCFFAASDVKMDFSTSSYVEKIVTMKKTKNNRFFVLKRAVFLFVHCTCSVQKGAQI
jgi:hypothetical protein